MNKTSDQEEKTVTAMIKIFCNDKHNTTDKLCNDCNNLLDYVLERTDKCPLKPDKPTCKNCHIHCYKPEMRNMIKEVMKYSGPRMIIKHPLLAVKHLIDDLKGNPKKQ